MVRKENVYQQLIFQDTIDQYLAFMKGNFDENQGIASIQLIPFSKIEGAQSKTVVEKKYDQKKMKGELIEQFCAENGQLYVVVREFDGKVCILQNDKWQQFDIRFIWRSSSSSS